MSQIFPRLSHLRTATDFQKVWKMGKRVSVPLVIMVSCENQLGYSRLGISIPKKNIRLAVDRNRLKRLARETFRLHQNKLSNRDIVIVAYKGAETLAPKEQYKRFNTLWDLFIKQYQIA